MQPAPNARAHASRLARTLASEPLGLFAALWPLALLAPFVPGLPLPAIASPEWRQELALSALLFATLLHASRRARVRFASLTSLTMGRAELQALLPLALFALWGAASALWADGRGAALRYGLTWAAYLLFFALARRAAARPRLLLYSVAALAAVVTIIGAASLVGHESLPNAQIGYNGLGEPFAVATPFFAALALTVRRRKAALACGLTAALAWAAALESAERAAFVSACAGLLALLLTAALPSRLRPRSKGRALLLAASFASVFLLMNLPAASGGGGAAGAGAPVLRRLGRTGADDVNTRARLLLWGAALEMFRAHPLAGVGAENYEVAFPQGRALFAERHPDSPLVALNEGFLAQRAHNEYLQMLAELGAVGFALFALFALALGAAALRALRGSRSPLAPASVAALVSFALSSCASSVSFRWMGSGLIFFFAAALVSRLGEKVKDAREASEGARTRSLALSDAASRLALRSGLALASLVLAGMTLQAAGSLAHGVARGTREPALAESRFRAALALDPLDAATHFSYGSWLYARGRDAESVEHLRYAVERGFNTSTCYQRLAAAQDGSGDPEGAERTLAFAARVYPRSVFLRVRHAAALRRVGRVDEAELEMTSARLINSFMARGWQQLIENDIDAAVAAAKGDPRRVCMPGRLMPQDAVFAVLEENLRRFPEAATKGWRAQVGSFKPQ
jgi:O-antigen ligase